MDEETAHRLDTANGEAMFVGLTMSALWTLLIATGTFPKEQSVDLLDNLLLIVERNQESGAGFGPGATLHARRRLEGLITQLRAIPI